MKQIVRQNFEEKASYIAKTFPGMTVTDHGSFLAVDCSLPSDTFNVIVVRDLSDLSQLAAAIRQFTAKAFPLAVWHWDEDLDQSGRQALTTLDLAHQETNIAMVADLKAVRFDAAPPAGLTIYRGQDEAAIRAYGTMLGNLFGDSAEGRAVTTYHHLLGDYGVHHFPAMRYYLGAYEGELVATGTLFVGNDTLGIYDIVTHPDFRHRGIGSAMFAHLLREARAWPDRPAVLQASPDGIGIYRRAGFAPVGEVHVFECRPL